MEPTYKYNDGLVKALAFIQEPLCILRFLGKNL